MKIIKKMFAAMASAIGVLILSGFLSLHPISQGPAFAQAPVNCSDVTGLTIGVPSPETPGRPAGIFDSGQIDFNAAEIASEYQACKHNDLTTLSTYPSPLGGALTPAVTGNLLKGWAWNTNVGYTSFYCQGGTNQGATCGSQNYQSIISETDLKGFAWNDNIGWISLNCSADGNNLNVLCGATNYGVKVAAIDDQPGTNCTQGSGPAGAIRRGDLFGYAWNDSVGWISFCGAHVDLTSLTSTVTVTKSVAESATPFANNTDYYDIKIQLLEGGVSKGPAEYIPNITATWADSVKTDQVTPCSGDSCYDAAEEPRDYSACSLPTTGKFCWNGPDQAYVGRVKSVAPTSATDQLNLTGISITANRPPPDGSSVGVAAPTFTNPGYSFPQPFVFSPPVSVTQIRSPDVTDVDGALTVQANGSSSVEITVTKNDASFGAATVHDQLYDCSAMSYNYNFDTDNDGTTTDEIFIVPSGDFPNIPNTTICADSFPSISNVHNVAIPAIPATPHVFNETIFTEVDVPGTGDFAMTDALALQTIISYDLAGKTVKYFSISSSGGVPNQAADIRGNVRIDVARIEGLPTGGISQSLGEYAQSKRESFYKVVRRLTRNPGALTGVTDGTYIVTDSSSPNVAGNIFYLNRSNVAPPAATPPRSCYVILNDAGDINFTSPITIVAEGCNVFIDKNIYSAGSPQKVGIISLRDFGTGLGGNIYICKDVTDVQANLVADGSLFSYGDEAECGAVKTGMFSESTGAPIFPPGANIRDLLKRQLTITGSLISNNTYGGSTVNPQIMCDGKLADTDSDEDKRIAKSCDINFLRYAHTRAAAAGESPDETITMCWANTTDELSKQLTTTTPACQSNFPDLNMGRSIVNIIYRAPSKDLPVFNAVR